MERPDGAVLHAVTWAPQGTPRAHVAVIHGYAEHAGRYTAFAGRLRHRGLAVHAFDFRGHGRSDGERGRIESFDVLVADAQAFLERVPPPTVVFGHSAGGPIALVGSQAARDPRGLVLSAPYVEDANPLPAPLLRLAPLAARVLPGLPVRRIDPEALSRDAAAVRAYAEDPLVYRGSISLRTGLALLEGGRRALQRAPGIGLPALVIVGEDDRLGSPEAARRLYERLGSRDKRLQLYAGGRHEPLHDVDRERVMDDLVAWIERRA